MTKGFRTLIGVDVKVWPPVLVSCCMNRGQAWRESQELWTSQPFKTTLGATEATDPSIKACSWGFLVPFWWKKGFPSLPSYYLHTVRDYIEARTGTLCLPICFFIWKLPQAFPLSSPYQAWPEEKTWLQKGQCSLDILLILHSRPPPPPPSCILP